MKHYTGSINKLVSQYNHLIVKVPSYQPLPSNYSTISKGNLIRHMYVHIAETSKLYRQPKMLQIKYVFPVSNFLSKGLPFVN